MHRCPDCGSLCGCGGDEVDCVHFVECEQPMSNLPIAREDGLCCQCAARQAVTKDGRFCKKCLRALVVKMTPMTGCYRGLSRTPEQKQDASKESNPGQENAIRILEDG